MTLFIGFNLEADTKVIRFYWISYQRVAEVNIRMAAHVTPMRRALFWRRNFNADDT